MTKVSSSYASITRGVSEQVAQDRLPGQHWEQVNMVSDPRRGVARRHGSITLDERALDIDPLDEDQKARIRNYREYSFFDRGTEYSLVYQAAERPTSCSLPFAYCVNKATGRFLNIEYKESAAGALDPWVYGGLSAVTAAGRFLVMASNELGPGYSVTDMAAARDDTAVVWVRGGAYSRTFRVTVTHGGSSYTGTYTTMASSYPTLLDTSDIPSSDPDYAKKVNDRVNAYNAAVNKWIGDASASVQPQAIASGLRSSLTSAGLPAASTGINGGTLFLSGITALSVSDSGDGTLVRGVFNEVDDPAKLSTMHYNGKVVKVIPNGTDVPYYMVATTNDGGNSGPVTWNEGVAQRIDPGQVFALATISDDGQTLYMSDDPGHLESETGIPTPQYESSMAGDLEGVGNVPYFFGRRVTLLTMFMDRLVIVSNGVVFMSRTGDYFNWFRKSMLRQDDDDPLEAYALGAEDDIIHRAVTYNRDLFMFGERNQYTISGRSSLTPSTVSIATTAGEKDSTEAQPIVVGNLLFYGKYEASPSQTGPSPYSASVSQFQLGLYEGIPESYLVSQQLDKYLRGRPIQFTALPSPYTVFLRTDGNDYGLYVYRFIDQPGTQTRVHDSWSRWEWAPEVGRLVGITNYSASMFAVVLRENSDGPWVALEQFVVDADTSATGYLDAQRPATKYAADEGFFKDTEAGVLGNVSVVSSQGHATAFLGAPIEDFDQFYTDTLEAGAVPAVVGVEYDSYVQLTSPYVRDQNDKALVNGRLVVNRYTLSLSDTSGLDAYRHSVDGAVRMKGFNGRRVGLSNNTVGRQPVSTVTLDVACGRANTEHRLELKSRSWLPLTISAIEWVGQLFNNARRV